MSSLSIPPLPSDVFKDKAMVSAASDIILDDCAGIKNREKFDGVSRRSQKRTPVCIAVAIPAAM